MENGMDVDGLLRSRSLRSCERWMCLSPRATTVEACRQIGIAEQMLYRWRKEYGGLKVDQARQMKDLKRENTRLKKLWPISRSIRRSCKKRRS